MNFAYLDPRSLLDTVFSPVVDRVEPIPHELEPHWIEFEKELGNFKKEFAQAKIEFTRKYSEFETKKEEANIIRMMLSNVTSQGLKDMLVSLVDKYETEEGIPALAQQCSVAAGKMEAYKKVLLDTNAERYAKFTCFVCMDRFVDLFFDPCGHVICEHCWSRTVNKTDCPGCRTHLVGAKRIFSMT